MTKKYFNKIISVFILAVFCFTTFVPVSFAATSIPTKVGTPTKVGAKKVTTKKPVVKKKVVKKKKEKLTLNPPLITLDTAPHSPKPVSKKKTTTKKKVVAVKKKA